MTELLKQTLDIENLSFVLHVTLDQTAVLFLEHPVKYQIPFTGNTIILTLRCSLFQNLASKFGHNFWTPYSSHVFYLLLLLLHLLYLLIEDTCYYNLVGKKFHTCFSLLLCMCRLKSCSEHLK